MATLHAGGVHASHSTASSALIKEVENRERKCQSVAVPGCSLANFSSLHKRALPQQQASTIRLPGIEEIQQSPSWETGTLQPSSLLHHAVSHGRFSLRNVLSTPGPSTQVSSGEPSSTSAGDPITMGLVTIEMASSLFDDFMTYLNPYISQLDAQLHTFDYVRRKSAFLLSAVLAVSAKSSHPLIYERLLSHAEGLLSDCFMRGLKSTEIAQAVMLLTYWKKPEDSRAWVFLGYTVRMGMELGWHRLSRLSSADAASMSREQQLEHRNIERTWYVLFVYDRSMSLQTAKPWMIERSDFTESIEAWCREPLAVPTDILLGAFVTLRLLTSEVFKLLGGDNLARNGAGGGSSQFYPLCSFFAIIKGRIAEWESKWTQRAEQDCHQFLIRFYAAHLRLQMFSLPLHEVLGGRNKDNPEQQQQDVSSNLEALWTSYSSAIAMLHLLSRYSSLIHLVQDSVHVMTAYSASFLLKLMHGTLAPDILEEIRPEVVGAMQQAAHCFRRGAELQRNLSVTTTTTTTSCALEASFLDRILAKLADGRGNVTVSPGGEVDEQPSTAEETVHSYEQPVALNPTQASEPPGVNTVAAGLYANDVFAGLDGIFSEYALWGGGTSVDPWGNLQEGAFLA
jgi:hypothetical protein